MQATRAELKMSQANQHPKRRISRAADAQQRQARFFVVVFSIAGIGVVVGLLWLANRPMLGH